MIFFKKSVQAKYPLTPAKPTFFDGVKKFWRINKPIIGLLIVTFCISVLIIIFVQAATTGHLHMVSTEANVYEHLHEVI